MTLTLDNLEKNDKCFKINVKMLQMKKKNLMIFFENVSGKKCSNSFFLCGVQSCVLSATIKKFRWPIKIVKVRK